jgi:cytochrome c5
MSDSSNVSVHDEDHTGPIKNPKQLLVAVFFSFIIPIFLIIGLVYFVVSGNKPSAGAPNIDSINERIQKVGSIEIRDANREMRTGEAVYKAQCSACHTSGAAGAPKFGDASAWAPRIKSGFDSLYNAALKGKNAMPAQGGGDADDFEIARAVVYMANGSGAKFAEPQKNTAAEPAK